MVPYPDELLRTAAGLLARRTGQRGRLASARIRRSISTSYYAFFHFLSEEVGQRVVGSGNHLRTRRRLVSRTLTHRGMKATLDKVRGAAVEASIADLFRPAGNATGAIVSPAFLREVANAFIDAQAKRSDADYNLNKSFSEHDARILGRRVARAIRGWRHANSQADRDIKHGICLSMLLKGTLRSEASQ